MALCCWAVWCQVTVLFFFPACYVVWFDVTVIIDIMMLFSHTIWFTCISVGYHFAVWFWASVLFDRITLTFDVIWLCMLTSWNYWILYYCSKMITCCLLLSHFSINISVPMKSYRSPWYLNWWQLAQCYFTVQFNAI